MKTILLSAFVALGVCASAQSFKKGQIDINLGVGIGNTFIGSGFTSTTPPISISADLGVSDAISLGLYVGYTKAKWEFSGSAFCNNGNGNGNFIYSYTDTYTWTYTIVGVRGAYHFTSLVKNDKVDLYAGLMLANNSASSSFSTVTSPYCDKHDVVFLGKDYGGVLLSVFLGTRYRLSDNVGVFAELGYGVAVLNLGLNLKF